MLNNNVAHPDQRATFAEKYELHLPFKTLNEFYSMDNDLKRNKTFKYEFVSTVYL